MDKHLEKWIDHIQMEELLKGVNNAPQHFLGLHDYYEGQILMAYRPSAWSVAVMDKNGNNKKYLERIYDTDLFGIYLPEKTYTDYKLEFQFGDNNYYTTEDPYSFDQIMTEKELELFHKGYYYEVFECLGAHPKTVNGVPGVYFAVWAPHARRVSVVGNFNMWDGRIHPMRMLGVYGVYELFIPHVEEGAIYKYEILTRKGDRILKADPYANYTELRPNNASVVTNLNRYKWSDGDWIRKRNSNSRESYKRKPMNIYEMHPGSWMKHPDGRTGGFYNYRELAERLPDYLLDMGYTHVELMGIAEHPFDGSWGYQVTGYYSPTSRYGTPEDFMYFVDRLHQKGIAVILDWVPAHFPKDGHGLAKFDGEAVYEHPDTRRGEHPHWGTLIFDYGKPEVSNFLISNAIFWMDKFHVDGLRVDAVASMLYLDYGREDGQWLPNQYGGNGNLEAMELFKHLNSVIERRNPGFILIAEESTAWPKVTKSPEEGGLGFDFKWNMGWMNDFLEYMKQDPVMRSGCHNKMTFGMMYAYSENFIQVLSHDEVVHGKCTMLNKMPGYRVDKFANLRAAYGFMYGHPGKKLLFMGQEFAQEREWSEERELDWGTLEDPLHAGMKRFVHDLNHLYLSNPACYVNDYDPMGFQWMSCDDNERSTFAFVRRGESKLKQLLFVFNFTPVERDGYCVGVPCKGVYREILNSDNEIYGGNGSLVGNVRAKKIECEEHEWSIEFKLPPLSVVVFEYEYVEEPKKVVKAPAKTKTGGKNAKSSKGKSGRRR